MGCPTFLLYFQPTFLKPLFSPVVQLWYLCATVPLFAFSEVGEFTLSSFHFSHFVQEQYLHNLTQARSPFVNLSSYPHQTIQPAFDKAFGAFLSEDWSASSKLLPFVCRCFLTFCCLVLLVPVFPLFLPFPLFLLFLLCPLFCPHFWLCAKNGQFLAF